MPDYDIALELARLHLLNGSDFIRQLKLLTSLSVFKPVTDEKHIFAAEGSHRGDFPSLLDAARKAVAHGNTVYILPNPKGIKTADFIFERRGVYKMFDLKTIIGRNSVGNRLKESVGQTNRVLLNLKCTYGVRNITDEIRRHFETSPSVVEVLIFLGNKEISVKRNIACSKGFLKMMMNSFRR
ncbi:MAG: hypothetical protein J5610_00985 [Prevotella sp.]|nr:hypothetical protein [Prevotella sp.]